jgi:hypothetical protein
MRGNSPGAGNFLAVPPDNHKIRRSLFQVLRFADGDVEL